MSFQCLDCSRQFTETRGLSTHLRFCREAHRKRKEAFEELLSASKRARYSNPESSPDPDLGFDEGTAVTDAAPEMEVLPESPPASRSFSGRRRKVPRALKDYVPHSLVGLPSHLRPAPPKPTLPAGPEVLSPASPPDPEPELVADTRFATEPNGFGLYRQYTRKPRTDPEDCLTLVDLVDDDDPSEEQQSEAAAIEIPRSTTTIDFFHPFPNATVFRCMKWFLGASGTLSVAGLDRFTREVILSDDFNREDLRNFSTAREMARLDKHGSTDIPFSADDGWKEASVILHLPKTKAKHASEAASPQLPISGLYYRPLLEVIKAACQSSQAQKYHWVPFKLVHRSQEEDLRAYTDIYNSDAMLEEDAKIRALGRHPDDDLDTEVAVLAMLLWSDSTHLASFGTASLWPVYLYFGNLSKYARGRPSAHAAHHLAYIPSVSVDSNLHLTKQFTLLSSPTVSKTLIEMHMVLTQWQQPKFCDSSRLISCKRSGS
jgi:hypothetical protein